MVPDLGDPDLGDHPHLFQIFTLPIVSGKSPTKARKSPRTKQENHLGRLNEFHHIADVEQLPYSFIVGLTNAKNMEIIQVRIMG